MINEKDTWRRSGAVRRLYHGLRWRLQLDLIDNEVHRLGRLLDIVDIGSSDPTGDGTYHSLITPLARTYLGVEPSLRSVKSAVPTANVGVVRGSGEQPLLRPKAVDVALCFFALDQCFDPDLVIANIAKALRDGGCAMIELKNANAWYRPSTTTHLAGCGNALLLRRTPVRGTSLRRYSSPDCKPLHSAALKFMICCILRRSLK